MDMTCQTHRSFDEITSGLTTPLAWVDVKHVQKGITMNNKSPRSSAKESAGIDLITAVEAFVANGGVIAVIPEGGTAESPGAMSTHCPPAMDAERLAKVELLRCLVAKGAGVSALQYSLRMNKKDIRRLATEHGISINFSRPIGRAARENRHDFKDVDDAVAGHAMHYSSLGYTVSEIAQLLGLTLRQVWDIGKAYRVEFRQEQDTNAP